MRVSSATRPSSGRIAAYVAYVGISPAPISTIAKASAITTTNRPRGRVCRRAASSAPVSEPTAMNVPRIPYAAAPLWNCCWAISAEVIWKFMPKVPTKNATHRISSRSPRCRT